PVTVLIRRAHNYARAKPIAARRPRSHVSQQQVSYSVPQHTMNKLSAIISFFLPQRISPLRKLNHRHRHWMPRIRTKNYGIQSERDFAPGISPRRLKGGATAVITRGPSVPKTPAGCDFVFLTCQVQNQISKEHNRSAGKRLE